MTKDFSKEPSPALEIALGSSKMFQTALKILNFSVFVLLLGLESMFPMFSGLKSFTWPVLSTLVGKGSLIA